MVRFLGYPLVALALFAMAGGHWAVLQTVAWAGMVAQRIEQQTTLRQAVAETLDGEHPCALCHQIAQTRSQEEKHDPLALTVKLAKKAEAVASDACVLPILSAPTTLVWRTESEVGASRAEAPSTRPPRGLLSLAA